MNYDVTGSTCRYCGDEFETGERVLAMWTGEVEQGREDDERRYRGTDLRFYHLGCASVVDSRPPEFRLMPSESGVVHAFDHETARNESVNEFRFRSKCGVLRGVPEDETVTVRAESLRHAVAEAFGEDAETCDNCSRAVPDVLPMAGGGTA